MARKDVWRKYRDEIKARTNWQDLAEHLGLELVGNPTSQGWTKCKSIDGDDENPSASFNILSGYYKDFRDGEKALSPYDLLYDLGKAENFVEAQKYIADRYNIEFPKSDKEDPTYKVKWHEWRDVLLTQFIRNKPPITVEGLKAAGARLCTKYEQPCIALPVIDTRPPYEIVGWMFLRRDGQPLDLGKSEAKCVCQSFGDTKGFVTSPTVMHRMMDTVRQDIYWVEGGPDLLAALSRFPDKLFITNPNGCNESLSNAQKYAATTGDHRWHLIADADKPGIAGALKRLGEIGGSNVKLWHPPFDVLEKRGADYRDYLIETLGSGIDDPLQGMINRTDLSYEKVHKEQEEARAVEYQDSHDKSLKAAHAFLKKVGCIIQAVDHGKEIELFSEATKSSKTIAGMRNLSYEDMIQFLGFKFNYTVFRSSEEMTNAERGGVLFSKFKEMLALAATDVKYRDCEKVGAGIWAIEDHDHERTGDLLIVKHGEAYKYDGSLHPVDSPAVERLTAKMSERIDWFTPDILIDYVERAKDVAWRRLTYKELWDILRQWNWANTFMPELCAGLIYASWMQSVHRWRPMVTLTGESNSGKTVLMEFIDKQFLGLANSSARSTAAGVLQSLGDNSQPILLDEFDNGTQQEGLLERFRVASRGQSSLYGTAGQSGKSYKIRHLVWFSGIYASSKSQADMNRMINLRLLQAPGNRRTIEMPSPSEIRDLGHRILASVIATANEAVDLADRLTELREESETIQSRYRESLSVPYGCIGAATGLDLEVTNAQMSAYIGEVVEDEVALNDASSDQEQLLLDILSSEVRLPNDGSPLDTASVAEILFKPNLAKYRDHARTKGVGYIIPKKSSEPKVAFAGYRLTEKGGLLKGTRWADVGSGLLQILERLPKELQPKREKQVIAGNLLTVISVEWKRLRKWCESDEERKKQAGL